MYYWLLDSVKVEEFLKTNPSFLDQYVKRNIDMDALQQWMIDRHKGASVRRLSLSRWRFGNGSDKCTMLKNLAVQMHRSPPEGNVLWELALCVSSAVSASSFVLYLYDPEANHLRRFSPLKE
jgi:cAMP and cAMP-inhibited cGMP 3',5'-cyclic phosphodiesterase 10